MHYNGSWTINNPVSDAIWGGTNIGSGGGHTMATALGGLSWMSAAPMTDAGSPLLRTCGGWNDQMLGHKQ